MAYPASNGRVEVGEQIITGVKLISSKKVLPESFYDKSAPLAGPEGLADVVRKGVLRKATGVDIDEWDASLAQSARKRDVPPMAGQGVQTQPRPRPFNTYVVLKPFNLPTGLYGAHVLRTITLPLSKLMLPKSMGKDMLPNKSQPDFDWLFALYPRENSACVNRRYPITSVADCRPLLSFGRLAD